MGQKIYDPNIAPDRLLTVEEVNAASKGNLSIKGGDGQSVGFQMPPSMPTGGEGSGGAEDILNTFPQLAGLIAQFLPAGKAVGATYKGAMATPAIVDMLMQAIRGEGSIADRVSNIDPIQSAAHAVGGGLAKGVGEVIGGVGKMGEKFVRKSLNLAGTPYANRAGEEMLPKLALDTKATMTREGVDAVADKAKQTGLGGLEELADALERARLGNSLGPVGGGGGIMSVVRDLFSPPRQMAAGQAMARPFGVDTAETLAPTGEAGVRAFLAWIASQLGDGENAAPAPPSGPRRRSQQ